MKRISNPNPTAKDLARFWSKVDIRAEDECWPWLASLSNKAGHGGFWYDGGAVISSRFLLTIKLGRVLEDDELACHRCHNASCHNPKHIYAGSAHDNQMDWANSGTNFQVLKERCPKGHPYSFENTYLYFYKPSKKYHRRCCTCWGYAKKVAL